MDTMRGPANFSVNDECGLLVDGFDSSPMLLMTYNPKYYMKLYEKFGFKKAMDLYAYYVKVKQPPERLEDWPEKLRKEVILLSEHFPPKTERNCVPM